MDASLEARFPLLARIRSPRDVKALDPAQLDPLANEVRERRTTNQAPVASTTSGSVAGSGTAADSGSAEGSAEPLPGPSEAPKCARHTS